MQLSNDIYCRSARFTFAILMALAWAGGTSVRATFAQEATAARHATEPSPAQVKDRLERCFRAIEAARRDIPRETFDMQAVLGAVGTDPAAILAWMRDHTAWVPYHGMLRGPLGVLMDRRGNSLDRATLLAELLRSTGKSVRLAHGELSDATAGKLRTTLQVVPLKPLSPPANRVRGIADEIVRVYGEPSGLDSANLRRAAEDLLIRSQRMAEETVGRTVQQSSALSKLVWQAQTEAAPSPKQQVSRDAAAEKALLDSLGDHWWVQLSEKEKWIDLDPDFESGAALPPSAETIPWQPKDGTWPLDSKFCHELELRVIIEKWEDGRTSEQTVLRQPLRPAELIGQFISVTHTALNWPANLDLSREPDPAGKVKSLASEQHEWLPVLRVGQHAYYDGSFTDAGAVNPKADLALFIKTGKSTGGAAGGASGVLDAREAPAAPPGRGRLTAEWLEYEVRSPGQPPRQIRRQIFDLLGPAARAATPVAEPAIDARARLGRGLSLLGQTEVLPLVCQFFSAFVDDLMARTAIAMRESLVKLYSAEGLSATKAAGDALLKLTPLPGRLYDLALARHFLNPRGDDLYLDQLNVLSLHQFLRDDEQRGLLFGIGIDIVANQIAVRPDLSPDQARQARLMQGVLDTNAEALLMDKDLHVANVADQLATRPQADQWLVVREPNDPAWQKADLPKDVRTRIESDLAKGFAVVIPRQSRPAAGGTLGWWRIDPHSGETLGFTDRGWGASMIEYGLLISFIFAGCLFGSIAAGKGGTPEERRKAVTVCAFVAVGTALVGGISAATLTLRIVVGGAIVGAGAGYAL
jgi:hypothetical protein